MKTATAVQLATSAKALADLLEITPSAVSQWGEDVPESRIWQLRVIRPEWFEQKTPPALADIAQAATETVARV